MSLSNNYVPIRQIGNGVTVDFSGDWKVLVASYIRVYLEVIATGVQTLQVYGVDYTLVFDDNGFTVTFLVAPTSANYVVIGRETDQVQAAPYRTAKGFQGDALETSLDKLVAQVQELQEQVTRAILFPLGSALSGFSFPAPDAGKGLRWNDAEDGLQNSEDDLDGIVAAAAASAVAAALSETNAASSASSASTSASTASSAATAAAAAAVAAAASQAAAASSASAASTSATNAATSAATATTQASNAATSETNAATSATNASNSATTASTQATNAATSATSAATQATNAAASAVAAAASEVAAAASAAQFQGTSATSLLIATGAKVFTTQAGKLFNGENVRVYSAASAVNYMDGLAAYSGTTLTVTVASIGGSGTFADWVIKVNGDRGATGATGAAGTIPIAAGGGTVDAITADFSPDLTLADKTVCLVTSTGANTSTTPSFAPDGLTARTIVKKGGVALVAGDIGAVGMTMMLEYNLANTRWELLNPCKVTTTDIVDGTITASDLAAPASLHNAGTAGGSANAQTLTPTPALAAYAAGDMRTFLPVATNTSGTVTVAVSGLSTRNIKKFIGGAVVILAVGDLIINQPAHIVDDGTQYILMNPQKYTQGADVASATTTNLDTATGDYVHITGTTTITGVTLAQGRQVTVVFDGALTFTNGASLLLPTAANITTVAGDTAILRGEASGVVRCVEYNRKAGTALAGGTVAVGTVIQTVWATPYTANADLTVAIPSDDTIPQITEGTEVCTVTIVPQFSTSTLEIGFRSDGCAGNAATMMIAALFVDATSNALAVGTGCIGAAADTGVLSLLHNVSAASTSSRVYRIRVGAESGTIRLNGNTAGRFFGGIAAAQMYVREIKG